MAVIFDQKMNRYRKSLHLSMHQVMKLLILKVWKMENIPFVKYLNVVFFLAAI